MPFKLPQSVKICLSTGLAALLLGLQNINEYSQQLESAYPELHETAAALNAAAHRTYLPQWFCTLKDSFSAFSVLWEQPEEPDFLALTEPLPGLPPLPNYIPLIYPEPPPAPEPPPTPEPEPEPVPEPEPAPEPEPEPEPILTPEQIQAALEEANLANPVHYRIMLMGDSLMEDLGPATHRALRKRQGLHFLLAARFSTGLTRPDYFNWPEHMERVVNEKRPDLIVVFMGANDAMPIRHNGRTQHPTYGAPWCEAYKEKMNEIFDIAQRYGCDMIWVGMPPMGSRYARSLRQTGDTQRVACNERGIDFLDTLPVFGDEDGQFRAYITDADGRTVRIRRQDKEHLTPEGNRLLVQLLLPAIERHLATFREQNPQKLLTEQERSRTQNAQLENTIRHTNRRRR
ncbi:MAG: DUF459 domain-containing protein [Akkermansia sp.]|nr:DUF459 domain-containing protein [Akkermansia sp.]